MRAATIAQHLELREQRFGRGARTGLVLVQFFLYGLGRTAADVVGLSIDGRTVARRTDETLDELEERANPQGSWRAVPWPVCTRLDRALGPDEWTAALDLDKDLREFEGGPDAQDSL